MNRSEALDRLRAQVAAGQPIIGAGAGTGLPAKCAEAGGTDLALVRGAIGFPARLRRWSRRWT